MHQGRDREGSPNIFNINHFVIKTSSDMGCKYIEGSEGGCVIEYDNESTSFELISTVYVLRQELYCICNCIHYSASILKGIVKQQRDGSSVIIRTVPNSHTIADVFQVNLGGPGSLNFTKTFSAFREN